MIDIKCFTTDELLSELKNRIGFINTEISLVNREYKIIFKTENNLMYDIDSEGQYTYLLSDINEIFVLEVFSRETPSLDLGESYYEAQTDGDGYYYCLTIVRLK